MEGSGGQLWQMVLFLLIGLGMAFVVFWGMNHLHNNGAVVAFAAILLGPPLAIYGYVAVRQGYYGELTMVRGLTWWHWMWVIIFFSGLVFRTRTATTIYNSPVDSAAVYRMVLVTLVAFWLLGRLFTRQTHWVESLFRGMVGCLTIFALYSAVTTIWSVYPLWSLYKSCEYSVDLTVVAAILVTARTVDSFKSLFDWTWTLMGAALVSAWVCIPLDPKDALEHGYSMGALGVRLKGVFPVQGANRIGDLGAIMCVVALARFLAVDKPCNKKSWYVLLGMFGFASLVLSQTRTAIAGCVFGVCVYLWFSKRVDLRKLLTAGAAGAALLAIVLAATPLGDLIITYLKRGQTDAQLSTLSSRLLWWETAYTLYSRTPLGIGMGAFAAEKVPALNAIGLAGETLHSDYMETLLGEGFYGLAPLLLALAGTWWFLLKQIRAPNCSPPERQLALEAIAVLGVLSVRTVFMDIMILHPPLHYFAIVGLAEYFRRRSLIRGSYS
ncbi:MAG: O-antigen ligase family protein [Acidobacteriia bacterium]|nr:O-antigen ligase family protein [Terriglobia bacterium]